MFSEPALRQLALVVMQWGCPQSSAFFAMAFQFIHSRIPLRQHRVCSVVQRMYKLFSSEEPPEPAL